MKRKDYAKKFTFSDILRRKNISDWILFIDGIYCGRFENYSTRKSVLGIWTVGLGKLVLGIWRFCKSGELFSSSGI